MDPTVRSPDANPGPRLDTRITDPALRILIDQVEAARAAGAQLRIRGGGTKDFYGEPPQGEILDTTVLEGISSYEPTELVVTARCGTSLATLEAALAEKNQYLPFEPPHFGPGSTVGGMVAAGLSGPPRASVGAVRDYVLGATLLNGRAEVLSFGGQVMKNVAGYDVSRLLAGSLGTLGVILEVSLKVLPLAPATATVRFELAQISAMQKINEWSGLPLPINASAWWDGMLVVRLRGALAAVQSALVALGGDVIEPTQAIAFWRGLRNQSDEYFVKARQAVEQGGALWRLSVPPTAPPLAVTGEQLIEWGGAQRWLCSAAPADSVRDAAMRVGGHATLFMSNDKSAGAFAPLRAPLDRIHRELKKSFDPQGVFNPGRLYPDL
ncbi:glycolate oxidase subunit GlcE [Rhizobacter sp. SG703]|uniref:glycolate oxidase subunit GlcE n=1 Tax=Rhizobacter sp. SG703 TaxID=2587140 RepID=UPI001448054B|nr:glycolate oxidase subunit GlcE [Rhizobacter sp. SG703]NKI96371.1 glycolate oxidase FAD binding subunit [Rhizobacter sp. SG703]